MRNLLGKITWFFTGIFGLCISPVIGQFFVELATERGVYERPSEKAGQVMALLGRVTDSWWFALALGFLGGVVFALWLIRVFPKPREWTDKAELSLSFDSSMKHETANTQTNIPYYVWHAFREQKVDKEGKEVSSRVAYVFLFVVLKDPTATNYRRIEVVGGGINCVLLGESSTGAVLRFDGDLGGRTIRVQFNKNPIPL